MAGGAREKMGVEGAHQGSCRLLITEAGPSDKFCSAFEQGFAVHRAFGEVHAGRAVCTL